MSSSAKQEKAAKLFKKFTGHEVKRMTQVNYNDNETGLIFGKLDGVMYTTVRDGKTEKYLHKFNTKSKPEIAASFDGQQLYIVGGHYDFTERGIVDRKK